MLTHEVFVFDDVVISGNGSLSVAVSGNDAIYVNGTLTIDGVSLDLMSETSDNVALLGGGIAAENDIIVKNGAEVSAIGADYAIASYGNLTITNSSITAKATKDYCNAIYCEYDIDIIKSTVKGESYYPALFGDNINICNGSTVNTISTADWGIWCNGGLNITGNCDVTAIGDLASMGASYSGISVTADIIDA